MKLRLHKRDELKKSITKRIRAEGNIPAVLYLKGKENLNIMVDGKEFHTHLQSIPNGQLATQIFDCEADGEKMRVMVKDITYHRTTYRIQHMDLQVVTDKDRVLVYVPLIHKGEDVCPGVTQGGYVKLVRSSVPVHMAVKDVVSKFELDVSKLQLGESIRIQDLPITKDMVINLDKKLVLLTIGK